MVSAKVAEADGQLEWNDLVDVIEGLSYATRPIKASAREVTDRFGLGPRGAFILNLISNGVTYPADLAAALKKQRSLITADLDRLKEAGLVTASAGDKDKRRQRLILTPSGATACAQTRAAMVDILRQNLAAYSRNEIRLFGRMLRDARGVVENR